MCRLVRCTVRRAAPLRAMRTRVLAARRTLEAFLSISLTLCLELSGDTRSAPTTAPVLHRSSSHLLLLGLFEDHLLVRVAHALALVGLRRLVRAHFRGDLADALAVDALDQDLGLR